MRKPWTILIALALLLAALPVARAEDIGSDAFRAVWERQDYPVQQGATNRSWTWGPQPFTQLLNEWYVDSPGGRRAVQYFDKSRMEINDPSASPNSPWYVTNGLLTRELVSGYVQTGDNAFIWRGFALIPVAGDPDNTFPTYSDLRRVVDQPSVQVLGAHIDHQLTPTGSVALNRYGDSPATEVVQFENGYGVPRVFWDFLNQRGPVWENGRLVSDGNVFSWLYVTGYPIAGAFWTRVRVGGVERDVMVQPFERRVLTYTPDNPPQWQVEMGNVGQHYYRWRYVEPFENGRRALITRPAPSLGETVTSPLTVQGFENGTAFEAAITVRLIDAGGNVLASESTTVHRPDIAIPGLFEATLNFQAPEQDTPGTVQVLIFSPNDGSPTVLDTVGVVIKGSGQQ